MIEISKDIIYIRGAVKGAIYNFNDKNLYWINKESCELIEKSIYKKDCLLSQEETEYITKLKEMNLFDDAYKAGEVKFKSDTSMKLELAWLEITQGCNCKCLHCYQGEEHIVTSNRLQINDWIDIIRELKQLDVSRVVVIGGEPCIYKDITAILKELTDNQIMTTLFTNATLIDDELSNLIVENKDYIKLKVSLYGKTKETHDKITQQIGSFDKLVANVKKLTSCGVRVDVAVVVMRENQDVIEGIDEFIKSLGAYYSKFDVIRNVFGGTQNQHTPTNKEIINSVKFCCPKFKAGKKRFIDNITKNSCWHGKIAITDNGDVIPCVFERDIVYGNVKQQSLDDIIHSKTLGDFWNMSFAYVEKCKDCEFRYACKDCRPLGKSVNGNLHEKNPRCCYNPYTGEWEA